ncbi:MAG: hypothetical protein LBT30_07795 [Clostridiales bacterium]|jgi:hypothetical protein|nr:hypothetical protein [Clostridiales bacterium]
MSEKTKSTSKAYEMSFSQGDGNALGVKVFYSEPEPATYGAPKVGAPLSNEQRNESIKNKHIYTKPQAAKYGAPQVAPYTERRPPLSPPAKPVVAEAPLTKDDKLGRLKKKSIFYKAEASKNTPPPVSPYKDTRPVQSAYRYNGPVLSPSDPNIFINYDPNFVPEEAVLPPDPYAGYKLKDKKKKKK